MQARDPSAFEVRCFLKNMLKEALTRPGLYGVDLRIGNWLGSIPEQEPQPKTCKALMKCGQSLGITLCRNWQELYKIPKAPNFLRKNPAILLRLKQLP